MPLREAVFALGSAVAFAVCTASISACSQVGGVSAAAEGLQVDDTAINPALTKEGALVRWGQPNLHGPQLEYWAYVANDGRQIWLWFDPTPPHSLRRALVLEANGPVLLGTPIVDLVPETRRRRLEDLRISRGLRISEVATAWGPPDGEYGSGVTWWVYRLADGGEASILVDSRGTVGGFNLLRPDGSGEQRALE
jgi:hypothetical protein